MIETAIFLFALNFVALVVLVVRSFATGYGTKKGNNAADLEDLPRLTQIVEEIKQQNAVLLEGLKSQNQLRVAAIDKRLAAHQEAFALWRKLITVLWEGNLHAVVMECQQWWNENCLYLEPAARDAFSLAYSFAPSHRALVAGMAIHGTTYSADIEQREKEIMKAGEVLVQAVQLPGLTQAEENAIRKDAEVTAGEGKQNG